MVDELSRAIRTAVFALLKSTHVLGRDVLHSSVQFCLLCFAFDLLLICFALLCFTLLCFLSHESKDEATIQHSEKVYRSIGTMRNVRDRVLVILANCLDMVVTPFCFARLTFAG